MIVGLIGFPVAHSKSPQMQNAAFAAVGLSDWRYELWETPPEALPARIAEVRADPECAGGNVTIPHKEAVMPLLDELSAEARAIGAVNTIYKRDGRLIGDNTDGRGFWADLLFHGGAPQSGSVALVLGAGGSARAVAYALARQGMSLLIWNRTRTRAEALLRDLAQALGDARGEVVESLAHPAVQRAALVVNCTSLGMWPNAETSPWQADVPLPAHAVVYDLVYRPRRTRLIEQAEAAGAHAISGIGMLAEQGAAAFERWTGIPAERVSRVMRAALDSG